MNEVGRLTRVVVKHARDAFVDATTIAGQWQRLNFVAAPDIGRAVDEYERFVDLLRAAGAQVEFLPRDGNTTLDSIYARDASLCSPRGMILGSMGKRAREGEPAAQAAAFAHLNPPLAVAGEIRPPGRIEGGDIVWFDDRTLAVGRGYRTNADGIRQLRDLLGDTYTVVDVPLPHWRGPADVMHLMSLISPVDRDLAVVYSRLMPVPFREWLIERGFRLIEVADEEFETMGGNILTLAPGRVLMLAGNPLTRTALERRGVEVTEYEGTEISVKGAGGPTCLTRPVARGGFEVRERLD